VPGNLLAVADPSDLEARLSALEARVEEVAADAAAARHLAAAGDRDLGDLTTKVEALRSALNALAVQSREQFDEIDRRFARLEERIGGLEERIGGLDERIGGLDERIGGLDERVGGLDERVGGLDERVGGLDERVDSLERKVDAGFTEMRGKFDQLAGGQQRIVDLLTTLIDAQGGR
jgi:chromosome segregation ATPase